MNKRLSNELIATVEGFIQTLTRKTFRKLYIRCCGLPSQFLDNLRGLEVTTLRICAMVIMNVFQQLATVTLNWS